MTEYFIDGIPVTKAEQDAYAGMSGLAKKSFELKLRDRSGIKDRSVKEQLLESAERHELTKAQEPTAQSALQVQEGGGHYKEMAIQPVEYIHANAIPFMEASVIKYVSRHRNKNGAADIKKAIHFLQLILELDYGTKES